jgi:hypothetical protein
VKSSYSSFLFLNFCPFHFVSFSIWTFFFLSRSHCICPHEYCFSLLGLL